MASSVSQRVQKHRAAMRAKGLRPVQIWVPDTRRPGFAEECARQSKLVAEADARDHTIESFMEAAWLDIVEDIEKMEK
jgi:hypothetical protein